MFGAFEPVSFLTDVSRHEGRALELLLASTGGPIQSAIGGAILDAAYVKKDPPLLARLAESGTPWVVNPQSVRFSGTRVQSVSGIRELPYVPTSPLNPDRFGNRERQMVRGALEFQAQAEPAAYMVPALPVSRASIKTFRAFRELHAFAADLNGSAGIPYRPMLAACFPSYAVMKGRFGLFDRLDRVFAGSYVQPIQLNTRHDSVEKLVTYVRFLQTAADASPPVIGGRVGPFGLVMAALGIELFESNLDAGGSFSLSRLERVPRLPEPGKRAGGRDRSVYFPQLLTPIPERTSRELLMDPAIGAELACTMGDCRGGRLNPIERPRAHFFHARSDELSQLRSLPTPALRVPIVHGWLRAAGDVGRMVNRVRSEQGLATLDLSHLDRWLGVLARVAVVASAEER